MKLKFGWIIGSSVLLLGLLILALSWGKLFGPRGLEKQEGETLTMFCAAGIRLPVEKVAKEYEAEFGVPVEITYAGSGELFNTQIKPGAMGDIYLAADTFYISNAHDEGFVAESTPIAYQSPVIAFRKELEGKITNLEDLLSGDYRLSFAKPEIAAISRAAKNSLKNRETPEGENLWDAIYGKAIVTADTVNQVANQIKSNTVDAGIIWNATAEQYEELSYVRVPDFERDQKQITVGVLTTSKRPTRALHFMRYLTARDVGLKEFQSFGYDIVDGDKWSEKPELIVMAGGLNRPAVYDAIRAFEKRENVVVNDTYNGCGILVGQIRAGAKPDMYFACDVTFLDQVQEDFGDSIHLSGTDMVMIVKKDRADDLAIESLADLAKPNLKVGLCDPQQSALGKLTKDLLDKHELWDGVHANQKLSSATADRLVENVVIGGVDAAIVYKANTSQQLDNLQVIPINDPSAHAVQPIAVGTNSDYKHLTARLVAALREAQSKERFESLGFEWLNMPVAEIEEKVSGGDDDDLGDDRP